MSFKMKDSQYTELPRVLLLAQNLTFSQSNHRLYPMHKIFVYIILILFSELRNFLLAFSSRARNSAMVSLLIALPTHPLSQLQG